MPSFFAVPAGGEELPCAVDQGGGEAGRGSVPSQAHVPGGVGAQWTLCT